MSVRVRSSKKDIRHAHPLPKAQPANPFMPSVSDTATRKLTHGNRRSSIPSLLELGSLVDTHPVVSHCFLAAFSGGSLTKAQIRFWAVQQFFFSISLPSAFAALYARIPDRFWKEKRLLVDLLKVETWGSKDTACHSRHFMEFCSFLEINLDKLSEADAQPYTQRYLAARLEVCLNQNRHLGQGLAAIGLGNEALQLAASPRLSGRHSQNPLAWRIARQAISMLTSETRKRNTKSL